MRTYSVQRRGPLTVSLAAVIGTVCIAVVVLRRCGLVVREPTAQSMDSSKTVTVALLTLSLPRQLAAAGVTVYRQLPAGVLASVQLRRVMVPAQFAPIVWSTPLVAL